MVDYISPKRLKVTYSATKLSKSLPRHLRCARKIGDAFAPASGPGSTSTETWREGLLKETGLGFQRWGAKSSSFFKEIFAFPIFGNQRPKTFQPILQPQSTNSGLFRCHQFKDPSIWGLYGQDVRALICNSFMYLRLIPFGITVKSRGSLLRRKPTTHKPLNATTRIVVNIGA